MSRLVQNRTVKRLRERGLPRAGPAPRLGADELRALCLDCGAADVGFVSLEDEALAGEKAEIEHHFPGARSLIGLVLRMNPEAIRTPARSLSNLEFHHSIDEVNHVARKIAEALGGRGIRAMNAAPVGFPMEMERWPGKTWVVSHKRVAVAAGLGRMGIHRNVIHPRFGSFVTLGSVVLEAEVEPYSRPLAEEESPCLECKLCVAACPTGAIGADGSFNFLSCYTHNYREFMGGFTTWVEQVAASRSAADYRRRVRDDETVSWWQSLGFGPNYKAAYCLAVCPAGEEVLGPFLGSKAEHLERVVRPLQEKAETVYVVAGGDAEPHVSRRFPAKKARRVPNSLRVVSVDSFLRGMPILFQPEQAAGLAATYHFRFRGAEAREATVKIEQQQLAVTEGCEGKADLRVTADTATWVRFLRGEAGLVWALLRGRIRLAGDPRLLSAFGKCFPA